MIKIERNPDGSIKAAYSVYPDGTMKMSSDPTPIPVLGSMPQATKPSLNAIVSSIMQENLKDLTDPITGKLGKRTFAEFKDLIKLNKENFLRDEGKFADERGGGLKSFNKYLDQLQSGEIDKLSPEEAKYIDDLKNNRINL
jgi:hypothetical protein